MTVKALAPVALLLFVALPTASAEVTDPAVDSPECWIKASDLPGAPHGARECVLTCPDHTCDNYPFNKDPFYLLPDLTTTSATWDDVALPADCWFSTREHDVGRLATIHDTCLIPCPDHTCHSYPWTKDPWYYVPDDAINA